MGLRQVKSEYDLKMKKTPNRAKGNQKIAEIRWIQTAYNYDSDKTRKGPPLNLSEVVRILDEEFVNKLGIEDHLMIRKYRELVSWLFSVVKMKTKSDMQLLKSIHNILAGETECEFRKGAILDHEFSYIYVHPQSIEEELNEMFELYNKMYNKWSPVLRGCFLHNEIVRINPFEELNVAVAKAILNFELIGGDYLPLAFDMDINVYRKYVGEYIEKGSIENFYNLIRDSLEEMYATFSE